MALSVGACASMPPPVNRMGQARDALQAAVAAKARIYAPLEMGSASDKLAKADAAMTANDYALAAALAEESQADSELARVKAQLGRLHQQITKATAENAQLRAQLLDDNDKTSADPGGQR